MPRHFRSRPRDAAVIPLPRPDTTPPVTKTYFIAIIGALPYDDFVCHLMELYFTIKKREKQDVLQLAETKLAN
jgi:hypothetical protein